MNAHCHIATGSTPLREATSSQRSSATLTVSPAQLLVPGLPDHAEIVGKPSSLKPNAPNATSHR